jgi:hypothetical protein
MCVHDYPRWDSCLTFQRLFSWLLSFFNELAISIFIPYRMLACISFSVLISSSLCLLASLYFALGTIIPNQGISNSLFQLALIVSLLDERFFMLILFFFPFFFLCYSSDWKNDGNAFFGHNGMVISKPYFPV